MPYSLQYSPTLLGNYFWCSGISPRKSMLKETTKNIKWKRAVKFMMKITRKAVTITLTTT